MEVPRQSLTVRVVSVSVHCFPGNIRYDPNYTTTHMSMEVPRLSLTVRVVSVSVHCFPGNIRYDPNYTTTHMSMEVPRLSLTVRVVSVSVHCFPGNRRYDPNYTTTHMSMEVPRQSRTVHVVSVSVHCFPGNRRYDPNYTTTHMSMEVPRQSRTVHVVSVSVHCFPGNRRYDPNYTTTHISMEVPRQSGTVHVVSVSVHCFPGNRRYDPNYTTTHMSMEVPRQSLTVRVVSVSVHCFPGNRRYDPNYTTTHMSMEVPRQSRTVRVVSLSVHCFPGNRRYDPNYTTTHISMEVPRQSRTVHVVSVSVHCFPGNIRYDPNYTTTHMSMEVPRQSRTVHVVSLERRQSGFDPRLGNSGILTCGNRAGRCRWLGAFSRRSHVFPALTFWTLGAAPYPPRLIFIGSPDEKLSGNNSRGRVNFSLSGFPGDSALTGLLRLRERGDSTRSNSNVNQDAQSPLWYRSENALCSGLRRRKTMLNGFIGIALWYLMSTKCSFYREQPIIENVSHRAAPNQIQGPFSEPCTNNSGNAHIEGPTTSFRHRCLKKTNPPGDKEKKCGPKERGYSFLSMQAAFHKIKVENWTICKASKHYSIPWSMLKDYVSKYLPTEINQTDLTNLKLSRIGKALGLSSELEVELVSYIVKMQELGFGLTVNQIRYLAYKSAE
ncbi:hypothetical protein PR048_019012 [Dryococelus australis]|uniref:Uncharacterized protein n=1 Tax=Dryococelus australis TaxID=614101 RepID=A0ABQ9H2B8_9NEOP|nr:hypothetical protein PR048_019012 [Dryococelus australis]